MLKTFLDPIGRSLLPETQEGQTSDFLKAINALKKA